MNLTESIILSLVCGFAGGAIFFILQVLTSVVKPARKGRILKIQDKADQPKGRIVKKNLKARWAEQQRDMINPDH